MEARPVSRHWRSRYERWFAPPQTLVLQPTTFCNLDCSYCYLPLRRRKNDMPPGIADAVARSAAELAGEADPLGIVWHGGEPLALSRDKFAALLGPFELLRQAGRVQHYVQTNATLVTDAWCELLARYGFRVGVSIDGPAALNAQRVDLRGRPAFERVIRGIGRLQDHGIPFSVIAVIGTDGIDRPEEVLDFVAGLGCQSVGLNIEETEGANTRRRQPTPAQAQEFWQRTLAWSRRHHGVPVIRDLERLAEYLHLARDDRIAWDGRRLDPIPTVSWNGDVVLLSPELANTPDPANGDFLAGNVCHRTIAAMLRRAHRLRYVREFITGLDRCQAECDVFDFCRGAQAANRYFENGTLASTETNYCRVSRQALITALSVIASKEQAA